MLFLLEGQKLIDRNVSNSPCKSKLDALNYTHTMTGEFCFHYLNCRRFLSESKQKNKKQIQIHNFKRYIKIKHVVIAQLIYLSINMVILNLE